MKKLKRAPLVLMILDGWGIAKKGPYNAISQAKTPVLDSLWKNYPHTKIYAHGEYVGLPKGQVGNSEAGHLNIGAGRVVIQDSVYISNSIKDGTFFKNPAFLEAVIHAKNLKSRLHIMGILSGNQSPHMFPIHVAALCKLAHDNNIKFLLHFFTDGRDSPTHAAVNLWNNLKKMIRQKHIDIATVAGRLYLDRKKNWKRTEKVYNMLVLGESEYIAESFEDAVYNAYKRKETDEFISPTLIRNKYIKSDSVIKDNDSIIFFNLRSDRARQLTKPFIQKDFEEKNQGSFKRKKVLKNIKFVAMTDFGPDLGPVLTAYPSRDVKNTLPFVLGKYYKQLYISEMEKYAHVTYFFNGGYENPVAGEERILVKSKDVDSYDCVPEMSSKEITDVVVDSIKNKWYNFICINFPNADMLGHTGNIQAAIVGCEAVDRCVGRILKVVSGLKGEIIITADHGNAEVMINEEESCRINELVNTMHETSPVPFIIYTNKKIRLKGQGSRSVSGKLGDVAPTILDLEGIQKPKEMTGESLIV